MFEQFARKLAGISPRAAIVGAFILAVAISGVALLLTRRGSDVKANVVQPNAARLDKLDGSVGIARVTNENQEPDWTEATLNTPITVGDRIFARDYAHASLALTAHNYVRLNPSTALDVLALQDRQTQLALRSGSALFDVGALGADDLYEVATPSGAIDFKQPGLYQVGLEGNNAIISVLNGLAQVVGQEGSGYISRGQVFTLVGPEAAQVLASTLGSDTAGEIVDDYYRYRYPRIYNGRYRSYDAYLADPSYYDPYRTSVSYQYLPADIPGLYDLDDYGEWLDVADYGHCWAPRVSSGWAPFRSGYWDLDDLWGPSWVSYEPWGWAPYHYGRWAFVNQRWFWVPSEVVTHHVYSPATVAFIPVADQIAWIPLGPGEVYVSRYYEDFRPRYLAPAEVVRVVSVQNTFVNLNAPGGVTVVPVSSLTRVIDPRTIRTVDTAIISQTRPVLDPFSVAGVRDLAVRHDDARPRIKFDRREQEALNTQVFASTSPKLLAARGNIAKSLRVESLPENKRESKLKVTDTSQVTSLRRADGLPQPLAQSQKLNELARRAEQGDKSARREMRQLLRQQERSSQQQQPAATLQEQLRQMKQQSKAERQQEQATPPPQQGANQAQQQIKQQRKMEAQQQAAQAAQQQQQQVKQQRRLERQQQEQQKAAAAQQAQQQMKQQRQAERQKQAAADAQRQQMRQQNKQLRRKPPQTNQQQQVRQAQQQAPRDAQMSQLQQQQKSERRAEPQQRTMSEMRSRAAAQAQAQAQQAQQRAQRQQAMMQQEAAARGQQKHAARAQRQQEVLQQQQQAARAQQQQTARAQKQQQVMQQQQQAAPAQQQAVPAQRQAAAQQGSPQAGPNPGQARKAEKSQRKPPQ
jgi:Family of unknown function (DUF6600)